MSKWPCSRFLLLLASLLVISGTRTSLANDRHEVIKANHGVVDTDDGRCSRIGRDVLKEGGHAVDAAVAAALCLGVVSPVSSGIGGGAFILNMYAQNASLKAGVVLSIAVPGETSGLHKAWKQYGKLPWRRLVRPATHLAHSGFKISPYLHMQMRASESSTMADKGLRDLFTSEGSLLQIGDTCYNKQLAKALRSLSVGLSYGHLYVQQKRQKEKEKQKQMDNKKSKGNENGNDKKKIHPVIVASKEEYQSKVQNSSTK
ncbi:hypothetical protein K7X08_026560 [Anisodus acutangulus]|uniref:Uncharacterized protein n=1 Tax=Anisodus acutangulus TaxID=402998 RepID=A0A9Q1LM36_9SOLA|nr:hypothetical protein K7X08_026560 [Anisodus acutangulus]